MDNHERLQDHIPPKEKKPKESFWAKPGRTATLSMWSAFLCVASSYLYITPRSESAGLVCTAICCIWAGGALVRAEQEKKAAKGQRPTKTKASDYVRSDSILGMMMGKNKKK